MRSLGNMSKKHEPEYKIEKAAEKLLLELARFIKRLGEDLTTTPKKGIDKMFQLTKIAIWSFLTYDLLRGFILFIRR